MDCTICANEVSRRAGFSASASTGPSSPASTGGRSKNPKWMGRRPDGAAHVQQTRCARNRRLDVHSFCYASRCPDCGCATASGAAVPRRKRRPWPERPPSLDAWRATGGLGCARHPNPLREVAPGPAVPCGKAKRQAEMGPVSTAVDDAVQPTGQPVGQQARHLLEAALDTLPDGPLAGSDPAAEGRMGMYIAILPDAD